MNLIRNLLSISYKMSWSLKNKTKIKTFTVQYEFLKNLPFPGKSHRVEEHHAEHLVDLDKEGFHAFVKYLVRRADIDEGGSRIRAVFDFCITIKSYSDTSK